VLSAPERCGPLFNVMNSAEHEGLYSEYRYASTGKSIIDILYGAGV